MSSQKRLERALTAAASGKFSDAPAVLSEAMTADLPADAHALREFLDRLSEATFDIVARDQRRVGPDGKSYDHEEFRAKAERWSFADAEGNVLRRGPDGELHERAYFEEEAKKWGWQRAKPVERPAWKIESFLEEGLGRTVAATLFPDTLRNESEACIALMKAVGQMSVERGHEEVTKLMATWFDIRALSAKVAAALVEQATTLVAAASATAEQLNDKFAASGATFEFSYGTEADFGNGLEPRIGAPKVDILGAMVREHCESCDSGRVWTTGNYGVATCPKTEWGLVVGDLQRQLTGAEEQLPIDDAEVESWREQATRLTPLQNCPTSWPQETRNVGHPREKERAKHWLRELRQNNDRLRGMKEKPLLLEEAVALCLYTGPMFEKYNAVNRGGSLVGNVPPLMAKAFESMCGDGSCGETNSYNRYTTTIHVLSSGLRKQSRLSRAETVYRGLAGGMLPERFWRADKDSGVKGGIEFGFLSTTTNRDVAMQYARGSGAGTVLEMQTGMIDRGACLTWVSQYPHEMEICFPPLTSLQVLGSRVCESVLVVSLRMNVNLASPTIEEVIARRHKIARDMFDDLKLEAAKELQPWDDVPERCDIKRDVLSKLQVQLDVEASKDSEYFNRDADFLESIKNAMALKRAACKVRALVDSGRDVSVDDAEEAVDALNKLFPDGLLKEASKGWDTLARARTTQQELPHLLRALTAVTVAERQNAAQDIGRRAQAIGRSRAAEAFPQLLEVGQTDSSGCVRKAAFEAIGRNACGGNGPSGVALVAGQRAAAAALPQLLELARGDGPLLKYAAARKAACEALGPVAAAAGPQAAADALPGLLGLAQQDQCSDVRKAACRSLGTAAQASEREAAKAVLPGLLEIVRADGATFVRTSACESLGLLAPVAGGGAADGLLSKVLQLIEEDESDEWMVRQAVFVALAPIAEAAGQQAAKAALRQLRELVQKEKDESVSEAARASLEEMSKTARQAAA